MTPTAAKQSAGSSRLLSAGFTAWLGVSTVSTLCDGVLYFAVAWSASGLGGQTAGLVLTLAMLPRTMLLLVGGAMGDRWGLRKTVLTCDLVMLAALAAFLVVQQWGIPLVLELGFVALVMGSTSAFRIPAANAFPKLFVTDQTVPRAMSLTSTVTQMARMVGPPLGGVAVVLLGMVGVAGGAMLGFAIVLVVLLIVRPSRRQPPTSGENSTFRLIASGVRAAHGVRETIPLLLAVALVAGSVLPLLSLVIPLLARERAWNAGVAGLLEAAWIAGSLAVSLIVAKKGVRPKPVGPLAVGPILVAAGVTIIAVSTAVVPAAAGAIAMGIGTATFTSHAFPLYLLQTPDGMLARFQALLGIAQAAPILIMNNVLGTVVASVGTLWAMLMVATLSLLAAVTLVTSRSIRNARS